MGKYTSAFDKIHVTPDMEKRIAANLENESRRIGENLEKESRRITANLEKESRGTAERKQKGRYDFLKRYRLVYAVAACCVMVVSVAILYFSLANQKGPNPVAGVVNPFQAYGSIDELKKALPFALKFRAKIPSQYKVDGIDSIGGKTAQIRYSDGNETITFRAAAGREDISGDTSIYDNIQTKTVSGMEVTLKGNGDLAYLAIWSDDACSYSLSIPQGMSEEQVLGMIQSLQ